MTQEELLKRLSDIEWDDFEVKEASGGIPKSMWETVRAFSNIAGGWIILGVKKIKINSSLFMRIEQSNGLGKTMWMSYQFHGGALKI